MREKLSFIEKIALKIIILDISQSKDNVSAIKNEQLANKLEVDYRSAVRYIRKLEKLGYIETIYPKAKLRLIKLKKGGMSIDEI